MKRWSVLIGVVLASLAAPVVHAQAAAAPAGPAAAPYIAGLAPDRRPDAAPREAPVVVTDALRAQRLAGVVTPWPPNVVQIADQSQRWYSPMFHPGMTGPYDLRHLHGAAR